MRIAFDSFGLLGPTSRNRDVGNLVAGLLAELLSRGGHEYFFLNLHDRDFILAENLAGCANKVSETALFFGRDGALLGLPSAREAVGDAIRAFVAKNGIDLFVMTSPFDRLMADYRKEWFNGCMTMAIVGDPATPAIGEEKNEGPGPVDAPDGKPTQIEWIDRIAILSRSAKSDADALERLFAKLAETRRSTPAEKRRLAFFSPLPPMKSGISDYSAMVVSGLSRHYEIDAFIDDGYETSPQVEGIARVFNHGEFFRRHGDYSATVYQMGNSLFHTYMLPYVRKFGGIVVLHDFNMHGTLYTLTVGIDRDWDEYEYLLRKDFPFDAVHGYVESLKVGRTPPAVETMQTNGFATAYADKVIVHSFDSKRRLLERNPALDVRRICHPSSVSVVDDGEKRRTKSRLGIPPSDFVFTMFGIVSKAKRAIPVLNAFRKVSARHPEARLAIVGAPTPDFRPLLEKTIAELGLSDSVVRTGFASPDLFLDYIRATDVCVNLRHPYLGETSGAMIGNIAAGNAVIVNDIGSFGEIPDDCCIKVPPVSKMKPAEEVETVRRAMARCLEEPNWLAALRERAKAFARENLSIEKCADDYRNFIEKPISKGFTDAALSEMAAFLVDAEGPEQAAEDLGRLADTIVYAKE